MRALAPLLLLLTACTPPVTATLSRNNAQTSPIDIEAQNERDLAQQNAWADAVAKMKWRKIEADNGLDDRFHESGFSW